MSGKYCTRSFWFKFHQFRSCQPGQIFEDHEIRTSQGQVNSLASQRCNPQKSNHNSSHMTVAVLSRTHVQASAFTSASTSSRLLPYMNSLLKSTKSSKSKLLPYRNSLLKSTKSVCSLISITSISRTFRLHDSSTSESSWRLLNSGTLAGKDFQAMHSTK